MISVSKTRLAHILDVEGLAGRDDTVVLEPVTLRRRGAPAFVLDVSGEDVARHLSAPHWRMVGGVFKTRWAEAAVFGWNPLLGFVNASGDFACPELGATATRLDHYNLAHPTPSPGMPRLGRDGADVSIDFLAMARPAITIEADGLYFGTPIEPLNWGMWLLQTVPAAIDFIRSGEAEKFGCYFRFPWQKRLLHALGVEEEQLCFIEERQTYLVENLVFRSFPINDLHVGAGHKAVFDEIAASCLRKSQVPRPARIFVSRLSGSAVNAPRRLVNEAALIDALRPMGFVAMDPQRFAFEDQVAMFASASVVVGLGGAGMFNAVFCPPGTKVVSLESSATFINNHANLFDSLGLSYGVVFGRRDRADPRSPHHQWSIDIDSVIECLKDFV